MPVNFYKGSTIPPRVLISHEAAPTHYLGREFVFIILNTIIEGAFEALL